MKPTKPAPIERRAQRRVTDDKWRTALTCIEPNKILGAAIYRPTVVAVEGNSKIDQQRMVGQRIVSLRT